MTRDELAGYLQNPNVQAFLRVIRAGETSQDDSAYTEMFGGGHFFGFADHPRQPITRGSLTSTAAGAYQFLERTWDDLVKQYGFPDFSPRCQDEAAVALVAGRGALQDVLGGQIEEAIGKCNKEWASLPGSPYGQPTRTMSQALAVYSEYRGPTEAPPQAPEPVPATPTPTVTEVVPQAQPEAPAMPFLIPALSAIMQAIPTLAAKWGGDPSAVATRNVAIAQTVVDTVKTAIGATNEQDVVEKLAADPVAVQQAHAAVQDIWWQIDSSGAGAAREADAKFVATGMPIWRSPSFIALCLLSPLVYWVMGAVIGVYGKLTLSGEVTASIITSVITLILGGAVGYYWGATTSANKPAAPPASQ